MLEFLRLVSPQQVAELARLVTPSQDNLTLDLPEIGNLVEHVHSLQILQLTEGLIEEHKKQEQSYTDVMQHLIKWCRQLRDTNSFEYKRCSALKGTELLSKQSTYIE